MEKSMVLSQIHGEKCWPAVDKLSPCELACPLHTDVPSYVVAIAQGKFKEALDVVRETNPLPAICGRVCHHPCETECNRLFVDKPIAIEWLKRFAVDYGETYEVPSPAAQTKTPKVAIIGSGPAGLTAAHDLAKKGYGVTIYEALPVVGGMLAVGIPSFILPCEVIEEDIARIKALGVRIKTGVRIGTDLSLDDLTKLGFNAILLATGAHQSAKLSIPGAELKNVHYALPFLRSVKLGEKISLTGKVVVIGGGNVAMDVARTAIRLGAGGVHIACLETRENMPAYAWEIEAAEKEGVRLHPGLAPQRFTGESRVSGVEFKRVSSTSVDKGGRVSWTLAEGAGSEYLMPADSVIIAIGQNCDAGYCRDKVEVSKRGNLLVDDETMQTGVPCIFAAGDVVKAPGTVTESMAAGRKAANSIDRYLSGLGPREKPAEKKEAIKVDPEMVPAWFTRKARWEMPQIAASDAVRGFEEAHLGYVPWQAVEEARRCLNCRMCANCIFERDQLCFETGSRLLTPEKKP